MASERGATVRAERLTYAYGGREVLAGLTLDANPGEVVGVLGPNGSGKSTLIRVLSGVLPRYGGSATVDGLEVGSHSPRELALSIAVVPQEPTFSFPFTALEVVLMGRHPHVDAWGFESAHDRRLAEQALERAGAAEFSARPIHELSSGERQRVVFARALAQQPRALLLDEPASFLDIRHQVELYDLVRELAHREGRTVLTVLHDPNLACEYCDRVFLLDGGRVAAGGSTDQVFTYANLTRVFQTEVYVDTNTLTGKLLVVPLSGRVQSELRRERGGA